MNMKIPGFFRSGHCHAMLKFIAVSLFAVLIYSDLAAAVTVSRGKVSSGFSMRIQRYTWADFECYIENKDNVKRNVLVRLNAQDGPSQVNVFSGVVAVPPKCALSFKAPVIIENSERFGMEVFVDGKKQPASMDNGSVIKILNREPVIAVLNDGYETVGAFASLDVFKDNLFSTSLNKLTAPSSFFQYKPFAAVIVYEPDFKSYSSAQIQALIDYVSHGGTLVFGSPKGALEAASTPLSVLLPVKPLGVRKVDSIPALSKLFPSFKGLGDREVWFLDSVPCGDGTDVLSQDGTPVFRMKHFGLGIVKLSAVSLDDEGFKNDKATWSGMMQKLLAFPKIMPNPQTFSAMLDHLTGFKVPSLGTIQSIVFTYLAVVLLIVILFGGVMKKSGWALFAAAGFSIIMTFFVLGKASSISGKRSAILAGVKIRNASDASTSESYYSFFADSAKVLNVDSPSVPAASFSSILPNLNSGTFISGMVANIGFDEDAKIGSGRKKKTSFRIASPIEIRRTPNGSVKISDLNIAARTSKQFTFLRGSELVPGCVKSTASAPVLTFGKNGMTLEPWTPPSSVPCDDAFLVFPGKAIQLAKDSSGKLVMRKEGGIFENPVAKSLRECFGAGFGKAIPYVALVSDKLSEPEFKTDAAATVQGREITVFPVTTICSSRNIEIPSAAMMTFSVDSSSRMIVEGNIINPSSSNMGSFGVKVGTAPPPEFSNIIPESLTVRLDYSHGGNIKLVPVLIGNKPNAKTKQEIAGKEIAPGLFVFSGDSLRDAFSPFSGEAHISISCVEKDTRLSEDQRVRLNSWVLKSIDISLKGRMPETTSVPFRF